MHIWNIRLGLATNSSSTHSIIFRKKTKDDFQEGYEFGWDFFTVASKKAKNAYVALTLSNNINASDDVRSAIVKDWCGFDINAYDFAHVDHQSVYSLPKTWEENGPDKEFFLEFKKFLTQDGVVILGGNDNDEREHELDNGEAFTLALPRESYGTSVARYDAKYNFWTVFNRKDGTKVRMKFGKDSMVEPTKASAPELIDIKITDFCPFDCSFCYQDSTAKGQHAKLHTLDSIAYALSELKVFEVALGGGETTFHPEFTTILKRFRNLNVIPNFTTKSLHWLNDPKQSREIIESCGAFAFSVTEPEEIKNLASKMEHNGFPLEKASVQYVMGSTSEYVFKHILEDAAKHDLRITLLGYKTVGRGDEFKPHDHSEWAKIVEQVHEKHYINLGIDTALAAQYQEQLDNIPKYMYSIREGCFSMYIDAVRGKMGESSYANPLKMKPLTIEKYKPNDVEKQIYKAFASF